MAGKTYKPEDYMRLIGDAIKRSLKKDCLIIFFGSVADGNLRRTSDIDVAIYCREGLSSIEYLQILDQIEGLPILRDIDLVNLCEIKDEEFLKNILERGKIWTGSKELLEDLKRHIKNSEK